MRAVALAVLLFACAPAAEREFESAGEGLATVALGSYNVNPKETTVSGVSSGGYMAVQLGVAWSSTVRGVGVFAAGPFWCAQDSLTTATGTCQIGSPSVATSTAKTDSYTTSGAIDATSNLAKQKIWIFSGYNDGVVKRNVVNSLNSYYAHYLDAGSIFYKNNLNSGHSQVTDSFGGSCATTGNEFINNCGYDAAGLLLKHLFGTLAPRNTGALTGKVIAFDQSAFTSTAPVNLSLSNTGYAYVPASCAAGGQCRVHIAFHGCLQNAEDYVGTDFVNHAGYNQWADTNNLIVLYPQTISSSVAPLNPNGCWDWWGYNEAGYATKSGSQIAERGSNRRFRSARGPHRHRLVEQQHRVGLDGRGRRHGLQRLPRHLLDLRLRQSERDARDLAQLFRRRPRREHDLFLQSARLQRNVRKRGFSNRQPRDHGHASLMRSLLSRQLHAHHRGPRLRALRRHLCRRLEYLSRPVEHLHRDQPHPDQRGLLPRCNLPVTS
jgi:poly(3-hydroxybutyrate) depolymerase